MEDFAEFVRSAMPGLLRYGHALTGNPHDSADLVHSVLEKIRSRWSSVTRKTGDPLACARMSMANAQVSRWRRSRRENLVAAIPDRETAATRYAFEDEPLWDALRGLPPRQRAVVVLRFYEGMTEAEIAAALGVTAGTIKSQAERGATEPTITRATTTATTVPTAPTASTSTTTRPTTALGGEVTATATPPATASGPVVGPHGFGALKIGMGYEEAVATGVIVPDVPSSADRGCEGYDLYPNGESQISVYAMHDRSIAAIFLQPGTRTPEGIEIGSPAKDFHDAYDHPDWGDWQAVVEVPGNPEAIYYMVVSQDGKVGSLVLALREHECFG